MLEDEQKLVERAKGGESEAFGLLYDHYLPKIYRFVLVKVSRREEAEDLTHQTFLKAWERIEQYTFQGFPFGSWLYRIARNTVIDYYRGDVSHSDIEEVPEHFFTQHDYLDERLETKIEWEALLESIRKLKEVEQEVLMMRYVEDMPHREIGEAIGKSEGAVKVIAHRALKNLKELANTNDR